MMRFTTILFLFFSMVPCISSAQTISLDRVVSISSLFVLTGESGKEYVLKGLYFPQKNQKAHTAIKAELSRLLLGEELKISFSEKARDRYARYHVNIYKPDDLWINQLLIENGLALFFGTNITLTSQKILWEAERQAASNHRGLWRHQIYQNYLAKPYNGPFYDFAIVSGVVFQTKQVKNRIYINFDTDWRQDFSASIDKNLWDDFSNANIDLLNLNGTRLQIRGWVRRYNGPFVEINDISQLQIY